MNMNEIERNAAFVRTIEQLQTEAVPSNFHTHCTFCDGRDEPEAIVRRRCVSAVRRRDFPAMRRLPRENACRERRLNRPFAETRRIWQNIAPAFAH